MPNPNRTDVIAIIDRSGSMERIAADMAGGFNQFCQDQSKADGQCLVTVVDFASVFAEPSVTTQHLMVDVKHLPKYTLRAMGGTPLLDAIGKTLVDMGAVYRVMKEADRPGKVICLIITDGEENASKVYQRDVIKRMIETQTQTFQWEFMYLGANVDAFKEAAGLGILARSAASYRANDAGTKSVWQNVSINTLSYRDGSAESTAFGVEQRAEMDDLVPRPVISTGGGTTN